MKETMKMTTTTMPSVRMRPMTVIGSVVWMRAVINEWSWTWDWDWD